jgi:hypothetical protein
VCVCASDYYQFLTCCTASNNTMGVMPHSVVVGVYGVGWYAMCMLREIYFLSFDVGIRLKICSRILRNSM